MTLVRCADATLRRWSRLVCVGAIVVTALSGTAAWAENRVALVIGNSDYRNSAKLTNPRNDAADVSAALKRIGFSTIVGLDLDKAGMDDIQIRFSRAARNADVAIFYYSGHAIQYAGTNYLLPVDAKIDDAADLRRLTRVDDIVVDLQQAKELPIMVLDSCRDNPLAESLKRSLGERSASVQRGLARLNAPQGMIVAYATQAGQTAADGGSARNSPYTTAFLKQIETKEEISKVFRLVSFDVYETSARKQLPELSLSVFKDFYLGGSPSPASPPTAQSAPISPPATPVTPPVLAAIPPPKLNDRFEQSGPKIFAQRVVLYDEDPANPKGREFIGSVVWRTEQVKGSNGQPSSLAVRGDMEIPERKLKMTVSFRRNTDTSLPASHTMELTFALPKNFEGGGISNVPGILMKSNEQARGTPLAGLAVKVTDGFFLVGLSNVDADRKRNLQLLKERSWFDIPIVYDNQRRGIIAIEKGDTGERTYAQAFAAWGE